MVRVSPTKSTPIPKATVAKTKPSNSVKLLTITSLLCDTSQRVGGHSVWVTLEDSNSCHLVSDGSRHRSHVKRLTKDYQSSGSHSIVCYNLLNISKVILEISEASLYSREHVGLVRLLRYNRTVLHIGHMIILQRTESSM